MVYYIDRRRWRWGGAMCMKKLWDDSDGRRPSLGIGKDVEVAETSAKANISLLFEKTKSKGFH